MYTWRPTGFLCRYLLGKKSILWSLCRYMDASGCKRHAALAGAVRLVIRCVHTSAAATTVRLSCWCGQLEPYTPDTGQLLRERPSRTLQPHPAALCLLCLLVDGPSLRPLPKCVPTAAVETFQGLVDVTSRA